MTFLLVRELDYRLSRARTSVKATTSGDVSQLGRRLREHAFDARSRTVRATLAGGALLAGFFLYLLFSLGSLVLALDVPPLRGRVNDVAGMLPPDRARALEERLARFERETGHQIAVLTVPTLAGDSLEDFSIRVAESWKIGQKGFDNGAILIVVRDDRKLRIEVGYGLEGILPDAIASRIIREVIVPRFRTGDFASGIEAGVASIMDITRGESISNAIRKPKTQTRDFSAIVPVLFMAAIFAAVVGISQRTIPRGAFGGAAAAGISTAIGAAGSGPGWLVLAALLGTMLGALSSASARRSPNRSWTRGPFRSGDPWRGGMWGPTFGGGGSGGGDFGGGGFSGGGGSFGGGGASGEW